MSISNEWLQFAPKPRPLADGDKWNVFLSYRSINRPWVLNLYDVLRDAGHEVFLDQCVLKAGDRLIRSLQDGLTRSQSGVLIWSDATRDSEWVEREYEVLEHQATEKKGFQFVPIRLDNSVLPAFAAIRVFLDFSAYPDGPNGGELLRLLHAIVGEPLSIEAARFADSQDQASQEAATKIKTAIRNKNPARLLELFASGGSPWEVSAALGCKAAEGLTRLDRNSDAVQMLEKLEQQFPKAIRPLQLHALALARGGTDEGLAKAQEIIGGLYEAGQRDPETLGIYGRTWMDRYAKSADPSELQQSRDLYAEAFDGARDDYYTGINAAAKSVFLGTPADLTRAAEYASLVQKIVGTEPKPGDYWATATIGEVFLIQRKYPEAARLYAAAVATARAETGSHGSTWKQACRLMEKLSPSAEERAMVREPFAHLPDCNQI